MSKDPSKPQHFPKTKPNYYRREADSFLLLKCSSWIFLFLVHEIWFVCVVFK